MISKDDVMVYLLAGAGIGVLYGIGITLVRIAKALEILAGPVK